jgi:hypothetical protein
MALWQFTTIAALIGVLLVYVMVLTNRIGATNALLKRIEEALVKPQPITENAGANRARAGATRVRAVAAGGAFGAPAAVEEASSRTATLRSMTASASSPTAEPMPMAGRLPTAESIPAAARRPAAAPAMESEARGEIESEASEMADASDVLARERRVSFLTVRDLKVISRSGRRSSDSTVGMSPLFREAMERKRADARSLAENGQTSEEQTGEEATHAEQTHAEQTSDVDLAIVANAMAEEIRKLDSLPVSFQELPDAQSESSAPFAPVAPAAPAADHTITDALPATNDEPAVDTRLVRATLGFNDEPVAEEAATAVIAANEESPAEAEAPTSAAADEQPAAQPLDEDIRERRRKREAQLILNAQRRRRRTRSF